MSDVIRDVIAELEGREERCDNCEKIMMKDEEIYEDSNGEYVCQACAAGRADYDWFQQEE